MKNEKTCNTSTSEAVFSYMRFGGEFFIFLICLLGQTEASDRGYSVGLWNDKQEGVEDTWVALLRGLKSSHIENMFPPRDMLPRMEIRVWVPRWWPRWISLVFSSTSGKGYSCPARDVENAYLFITNVLTSDAHVVLRPWSMTDSVISLQKPNQSVLGDFLSIRLISLLSV